MYSMLLNRSSLAGCGGSESLRGGGGGGGGAEGGYIRYAL